MEKVMWMRVYAICQLSRKLTTGIVETHLISEAMDTGPRRRNERGKYINQDHPLSLLTARTSPGRISPGLGPPKPNTLLSDALSASYAA
jgi:hypothetical protein